MLTIRLRVPTASHHPLTTTDYAAAFAPESRPIAVTSWRAAVGIRAIPGTPHEDSASCYPLMPLAGDADLPGGLAELAAAGAVSFVGVTDPHFSPSADDLARHFPIVRPFKTHFAIDRALGPPAWDKHHRYETRRAERRCAVRRAPLADVCDLWCTLYGELVARHQITGPAAFGDRFFQSLSAQPHFQVFLAEIDGALVGASIWFRHADVAYYFLNASNPEGYANGAAYALMAAACDHYAECRWINLGGVAGSGDNPNDGLARFKRGFANATLQNHLIAAILDPALYASLSAGRPDDGWFPAYRRPNP